MCQTLWKGKKNEWPSFVYFLFASYVVFYSTEKRKIDLFYCVLKVVNKMCTQQCTRIVPNWHWNTTIQMDGYGKINRYLFFLETLAGQVASKILVYRSVVRVHQIRRKYVVCKIICRLHSLYFRDQSRSFLAGQKLQRRHATKRMCTTTNSFLRYVMLNYPISLVDYYHSYIVHANKSKFFFILSIHP